MQIGSALKRLSGIRIRIRKDECLDDEFGSGDEPVYDRVSLRRLGANSTAQMHSSASTEWHSISQGIQLRDEQKHASEITGALKSKWDSDADAEEETVFNRKVCMACLVN